MLFHPYIPAIQQLKTRFVFNSHKKTSSYGQYVLPLVIQYNRFLVFYFAMLSIGSAWPTISSDLRDANYVKIRHLGIK